MAKKDPKEVVSDAPKKLERLQAVRGMKDTLPEDHAYFTLIKKVIRHRARQAGFRRISTPILEDKNVFTRAVGDATDIVEKELYTLTTKEDGPEFALKPEGTAGVMRAFIEHGMGSLPQPVELYYIEPHFRHDRPQKGRYRQFHQFGLEVLGESDPAIDAQIIQIVHHVHEDLQIADGLQLELNTIGSLEDREGYIEQLRDFFIGKERNLCDQCVKRLETSPLRILDCKEEDCRLLAGMAPKLADHLSRESLDHYAKTKELLAIAGISYTENPSLVRGLDYYSHTVFEFVAADGLSVGGGGRYDGLAEQLGGAHVPACGYAGGIERVIALMKAAHLTVPNKDQVDIFVAQLGWEAKKEAMKILTELRELGAHTLGALGTASMKSQLGKADKFDVKYTIILGEVEIREGRAIIRDMAKGMQEIVPLRSVVQEVIAKLGKRNLDTYDPSDDIGLEALDPADELLIRD